ncbi:prothrombin [Drosophila ficusphila]|uniref:prothrombin n=1 Tax=Drosophila ficusphila TaxID=30025 RepID=UPI0007E6147F|nr:prothrombin [Drosophila ficusphila]
MSHSHFHLFCASREMKIILAWIALLSLILGHVAAYRLLEERCDTYLKPVTNRAINFAQQAAAWMAAIYNDRNYLCDGTLITRSFILTTAHCVNGQTNLFVELGAYNKSEPLLKQSISLVVIHKLYNGLDYQNDISLLKLSKPLDFNAHIYPICIVLDTSIGSHIEDIRTFKAFGWGPNHNGLKSEVLQTVTLNQKNRNDCRLNSGATNSSKQICAFTSKQTNCPLKSGGPLTVLLDRSNSFQRLQFGMVGQGRKDCRRPEVYTDLTIHFEWIEAKVNSFKSYDNPVVSSQDKKWPSQALNIDPKPLPKTQQFQELWLHKDCAGKTISSKLRATIRGPNYVAQGVFITERFVITTARGLPENPDSLDVGLSGTARVYNEFRVDSIFKHPANDIALLKLDQPVRAENLKPTCMLANKNYREQAESYSPFTIFDRVQANDGILIYSKNVTLIHPHECTNRIQKPIEPNQLCAVTPLNNQNYGKPGDILGKVIWYSQQEWLVLFGISTYSSNGVRVFTNVARLTDWIANIVNFN